MVFTVTNKCYTTFYPSNQNRLYYYSCQGGQKFCWISANWGKLTLGVERVKEHVVEHLRQGQTCDDADSII